MTKWQSMTDLQQRAAVAEKVLKWRKMGVVWRPRTNSWLKPSHTEPPDWSWSLFGQIVEAMRSRGLLGEFMVELDAANDGPFRWLELNKPIKAAAEAALRVVAPEMFDE